VTQIERDLFGVAGNLDNGHPVPTSPHPIATHFVHGITLGSTGRSLGMCGPAQRRIEQFRWIEIVPLSVNSKMQADMCMHMSTSPGGCARVTRGRVDRLLPRSWLPRRKLARRPGTPTARKGKL